MLTVQRLQPVRDIEWLKSSNAPIGCDGDSFVMTYLQEVLKLTNIIQVTNESAYQEHFRNKSITAAVFEIPYEKVFINKYCKGFSTSTQTYRFGGFGFVSNNYSYMFSFLHTHTRARTHTRTHAKKKKKKKKNSLWPFSFHITSSWSFQIKLNTEFFQKRNRSMLHISTDHYRIYFKIFMHFQIISGIYKFFAENLNSRQFENGKKQFCREFLYKLSWLKLVHHF